MQYNRYIGYSSDRKIPKLVTLEGIYYAMAHKKGKIKGNKMITVCV